MLRSRQPEWMDAPDADPAMLERSLRFIQHINSVLGYTRATLGHLERFSQRWDRSQTIRMLDLATGSADVPLAILRWADRRGWKIQVVGVDKHLFTVQTAQRTATDRRLTIVQADVFDLPFDAGSFDYVISSMFLHHLSEEEVVRVMRTMDRLAKRGVIIADLLRDRRALAWITFFTLFSNRMVRHDARVSVKQAFTAVEICKLREKAKIPFAVFHRHFGHRFVLAGERTDPSAIGPKRQIFHHHIF